MPCCWGSSLLRLVAKGAALLRLAVTWLERTLNGTVVCQPFCKVFPTSSVFPYKLGVIEKATTPSSSLLCICTRHADDSLAAVADGTTVTKKHS